jgi:O-antigen/teichoic acid export membrane protein
MLGSLMVNIPRYFIESTAGAAKLAVYSAMAYIMTLGGIAIGSFLQASAARLARYYVEDLLLFHKLLFQLIAIAATIGIMGVLAAALVGRQFLAILYRPEYAAYPAVLTWLMAAAGVSSVASALGFGLAAARKFDVQLLVYICAALVTGVASALLVPRYSLEGGAWSLMLGVLTWCAGFAVALTFVLYPRMNLLLRSPMCDRVATRALFGRNESSGPEPQV